MNTGLLKIVRNLFLEKEELNRFYGFINDRFNVFMQQNTDRYGIIGDDSFFVEAGTNAGTIKFSNDSYAVDSLLNFIQQKAIDNISTSSLSPSVWYWLKIAYANSAYEIGTINIDINGVVTGTGTEFLSVIRGQNAKAPSRITLYENDVELGDYEVIDVDSDLIATINSSFVVAKTGLKYAVTGTFTLGETIPNIDKNIFIYDSVVYSWVLETVLDTPPGILDADKEFYIARIYKSGSTLTIQDKRDGSFYLSKGQSEAIQKAPLNCFKGFGENFYLWGCEITGDWASTLNVAEGLMVLGGDICYCPAQTLTNIWDATLANFFFVIDTQISSYDRPVAKLKYYASAPVPPYICLNDLPTPILAKQIELLLNSLTDIDWHYIGDLGEPDTTFATIKDVLNPRRARFRKDFTGIVYIECSAYGDTYEGTLFTLPAGYRPDRELEFFAINVAGNFAGSILTNGDVSVNLGATDLYLNIFFKAV